MDVDELLLECLKEGRGRASGRPGTLTAGEWQQIVCLAGRHGVGPLLYRRLEAGGRALHVPSFVLQELRRVYLRAMASNMLLYHGLAQALQALGERRVPVIVLKGAHLAEVVYGDIALRSMADVDVLVPRENLGRAMEALEGLGYRQYRRLALEPDQVQGHHLPPLVRQGAVGIELHWTLISSLLPMARRGAPCAVDLEQVWHRAADVTIAGVRTKVLSPEDLLLHLCVHLAFHHRFRTGVRTACDIAALIGHHQALDWRLARETAQHWRVSRCVYMALALSRDLLDVHVPEDSLASFEPSGMDRRLVDQARRLALDPAAWSGSPNVARVWQARRWRDKVRGLLAAALPSRQVMAGMYPAPARIAEDLPVLPSARQGPARQVWTLRLGSAQARSGSPTPGTNTTSGSMRCSTGWLLLRVGGRAAGRGTRRAGATPSRREEAARSSPRPARPAA